MTDPYETILLAVDDAGVATLTLNRPEAMNAWNDRMAHEIDQAGYEEGDTHGDVLFLLARVAEATPRYAVGAAMIAQRTECAASPWLLRQSAVTAEAQRAQRFAEGKRPKASASGRRARSSGRASGNAKLIPPSLEPQWARVPPG